MRASLSMLGQAQVVRAWQVGPGIPDLAFDEVEVVEQPFRRRRHELAAMDVVGEDAIRLAQHAGVVLQAREEGAGLAARISAQGEARGEGSGPFLQKLDAQELGPKWLLWLGPAAASKDAAQRSQGVAALRPHSGAPSLTMSPASFAAPVRRVG